MEVVDTTGKIIPLYPDVPRILRELVAQKVTIIAASRTATPPVAEKLLRLYRIDNVPVIEFFNALEWGQGSKRKHILSAAKKLGLVAELERGDFILFDDEERNRDVERVGCHFAYVPDGLTYDVYLNALKPWQDKK